MTFPPSVVPALRCPVCREKFGTGDGVLRCASGHSYDIARQGYVNLLGAAAGDNKEMVAARAGFLGAGHFAPLAGLVAARAAPEIRPDGLVVDAGTGTGYYLTAVLAGSASAAGIGLDMSTAALRRAARAHARIGAVAWDLWKPWPVASGAADVVMTVFAPRNPAESARVLRPGGTLLVVTPTAGHLGELREHVGILAVEEDKLVRLDTSMAPYFELTGREECRIPLTLSPQDVHRVVHMGPNAHHTDPAELAAITEPMAVTASFVLSLYGGRGDTP